MEEKIGAYKINEKGEIVPDENDEAMSKRHNLKKKEENQENIEEAKNGTGK